MKVSVIIPVYNEEKTIEKIIKRVEKLPFKKEIIVVNDGSTNGTKEILKELNPKKVRVFSHRKNMGKGAAVRTGLKKATGEIIVIQDADLEYSPEDLPKLIKPILKDKADVVYGSRFMTVKHHPSLLYYGNRFLTFLTQLLFMKKITDMETCYKVFRKKVIKGIRIKSDHFDFEPEITAKIFKKDVRFLELPISYHGRTYEEGKKLTWKDGLEAFFTLLKYRFNQ